MMRAAVALVFCLVAAAGHSALAFLPAATPAPGRAGSMVMRAERQDVERRTAVLGGLGSLAALVAAGSVPATAWAETTTTKKVSASKVRETPNGVKYVDVVKGEGESPKPGDFCIISYTGYLPDGTIFDGQHAKGKGKPLAFKIGAKQVIPGLEEALLSMKAGGERQLLVPPELAFGAKGVCIKEGECLVPPNSPVKFDVILKRVAVSPI